VIEGESVLLCHRVTGDTQARGVRERDWCLLVLVQYPQHP